MRKLKDLFIFNINKREGKRKTMGSNWKLSKAIKNNDLEKVKYLLEQGADLHAFSEEALRFAAEYGHLELVKYLLQQGANLHAWGDYALSHAAKMATWR